MAGFTGAAGRTGEFSTGTTGEQDPSGVATAAGQDPHLNLNGQQFNDQVPAGVRATSVLQPIQSNPGGNGMSAGDAARRTFDGQYLGSVNGTSVSSFEPSALLKLAAGRDTGIT